VQTTRWTGGYDFINNRGEMMANRGKSIREAKAERAYQKRRALKRKRVMVLLVEVLILLILLGIGYVMTHFDAIQQMEWFQNIAGMLS
jgi:hypothetical protein